MDLHHVYITRTVGSYSPVRTLPSTENYQLTPLRCRLEQGSWGQHGAIWGRQDPGGPHVDPMNLAIKRPFAAAGTIAVEQPTAKHQTIPICGYLSYQDTSLPTCLFHVIVSVYVCMLLFHVMYHGIGKGFFCWYSRMYICYSACVQGPNIHMAYLSHFEISAL